MSAVRQLLRHPEYRYGLRDAMSVAPGLAAWGLMTGVAMVKSGMSWSMPAARSWRPFR